MVVFELLLGLFFGDRVLFDRVLLFGDLDHLFFDLFEILFAYLLFCLEVVVKALFDDRSDIELGIGIKMLDGLSHQVRCGMA